MKNEFVKIYDSLSAEYSKAFAVFLEHTNQKENMNKWLQQFIYNLPQKQVLIDAGAGNGEATKKYAALFTKTIAIEPNPFLCEQLKKVVSTAEIIPAIITDVKSELSGDLVLCSHIFYYIPHKEWLANLKQLASWLSPTGTVVVVLQDYNTDCMAMMEYFFGYRYNLQKLADDFQKTHQNNFHVQLERNEAYVETRDFESAYIIAEFMLNLFPIKTAPMRQDLEKYIQTKFKTPEGSYRFSCHQDFLQIRNSSAPCLL